MLKQKYFLADIFILSAEKQPIKLSWRKIEWLLYFCKPYHSWERGANENTNGLIRQYIPKGTDFSEVTNKRIKWIENNLNNRPRKRLGYLTPNEKFKQIINMNSVAFVT